MSDKETDQIEDIIKILTECFFFVVSFPFLILMKAYYVTVLWEWFVIPVLGIRQILIPETIGLLLIYKLATRKITVERGSYEFSTVAIIGSFILPTVFFGLCWFIKLFM